MKKIFLNFIFLIILSSCVVLNTSKNKRAKIKQIRFYQHKSDDSTNLNRDSIFSLDYLNTKKYTKTGDLLENLVYDSKGNLISKTIFTHNSFNRFSTNTVYKNGEIETKSYYYYEDKKQTKVLTYNKDSVLISENHNKYRNGNMIALKGVYHISNSRVLYIMKYDKNNNLIYLASSGFYDIKTFREYKYDKRGREILEIFTKEGNQTITTSYYDSQNNVIKLVVENKLLNKSSVYNYQYEYDHQFNWIRKDTYYNNSLWNIELRELTYYD